MNRIEHSQKQLEYIISNHQKYDFPDFMRKMRESIAVSRKIMATDLKLNYEKLSYIENGDLRSPPSKEYLKRISKYFGVSSHLMTQKVEKFCKEHGWHKDV
jgi:ribosome-binding protein aMBF1 (putative translation factor)